MPRNLKIALTILGVAVVIGLISLRNLKHRVESLGHEQETDEQARREVMAPPLSTSTDVSVEAQIFWMSPTSPDVLEPSTIELPLSADPAQRSKQLLRELIASPPAPAQRTLPADAALLGFYILPDGTAVADFSDALSKVPSGILSEQLAIDSVRRTLESNVSGLKRLKLLLHGQEAETLAGHVDLTGVFDLTPSASLQTPRPAGAVSAPANPVPRSGIRPPGETSDALTASAPPGKLHP